MNRKLNQCQLSVETFYPRLFSDLNFCPMILNCKLLLCTIQLIKYGKYLILLYSILAILNLLYGIFLILYSSISMEKYPYLLYCTEFNTGTVHCIVQALLKIIHNFPKMYTTMVLPSFLLVSFFFAVVFYSFKR